MNGDGLNWGPGRQESHLRRFDDDDWRAHDRVLAVIADNLRDWAREQRKALPERRTDAAHGALEQIRDLERELDRIFGPENGEGVRTCHAESGARDACQHLAAEMSEVQCPCGRANGGAAR